MKVRAPISVFIIFSLSGFSALVYQVTWQRMLFTRLGANIESVTIIVSVFMAGLGFGALLGGKAAARHPSRELMLFGFIQLLIGIYGALSLSILQLLPHSAILLSASLLFLFPTLLMGATLPLLTAGLAPIIKKTSSTVSLLSFANTLGSSFACMATVFLLFKTTGLSGTIYIVSAINILAGIYMLGREFLWEK